MEIGSHILTNYGYVSAADRAKDIGANVYQIFYRSPQSYKPYERPEEQTLELAKRNKEYGIKMVIHGAYVINLCQDPLDYRHHKGVDVLVADLNVSVKLNAIGVIIHMGKDTEKKGPIISKANYVKGIQEALRRSDKSSTLILETGAGCGTEVSTSLKELGEIRSALSDDDKKRVKFCLDTCHMFAYGYRLDMVDAVKVINMDIEQYLGWNNVAIIHLNDSEDVCGSRKDNHADIGKGKICFEGLMSFVHLCVQNKIPIVLETPTRYYNNERYTAEKQIKMIKSYHNIMYEGIGPNVVIKERTSTKVEMKKMRENKKKNNDNVNADNVDK
jgi:deoxyribonuclease-4